MKRGKIEQSVLVSILLAIIIGGVILVTIVFPVSSAGGGLSDGLCHFNMALRTALPTTTKPIAGTSLCREIEIGTINADKYSKCPKSYDADPVKCGAYQLAVLADRCLYRGGGSSSVLGVGGMDWQICFNKITVRNRGELPISENDVKAVINENEFTHKIRSADITFGFEKLESLFGFGLINIPKEKDISKGEGFGMQFIVAASGEVNTEGITIKETNYVCIGDTFVCKKNR